MAEPVVNHEKRPLRRLESARRRALPSGYGAAVNDSNEDVSLDARAMAQLTVRKVGDEVVGALKRRATAHGRSTEAEHRNILRTALLGAEEDFAPRAATCGRALPERATGGPEPSPAETPSPPSRRRLQPCRLSPITTRQAKAINRLRDRGESMWICGRVLRTGARVAPRLVHTLAPLAHKLPRNNHSRSRKTGQFYLLPTLRSCPSCRRHCSVSAGIWVRDVIVPSVA